MNKLSYHWSCIFSSFPHPCEETTQSSSGVDFLVHDKLRHLIWGILPQRKKSIAAEAAHTPTNDLPAATRGVSFAILSKICVSLFQFQSESPGTSALTTRAHLEKTEMNLRAGGFIDPAWLSYSEVIQERWIMLGAAGCFHLALFSSIILAQLVWQFYNRKQHTFFVGTQHTPSSRCIE